MSAKIYLEFTVRKKDLSDVTEADLANFLSFLRYEMGLDVDSESARILAVSGHGGKRINVSACDRYFVPGYYIEYTAEHPDMQMEIIVDGWELGEVGRTRCLYEGGVVEELNEVHYFVEPKRVLWKENE